MNDDERAERLWHYIEDGVQKAPVLESEIMTLLESGSLPPDTLVWTDGMEEWQNPRTAFPGLSLSPHPDRITSRSPSGERFNLLSWLCCLEGGIVGFFVAFIAVSTDDIRVNLALCIPAALVTAFTAGYIATVAQIKKQSLKNFGKQSLKNFGKQRTTNIGERLLTVLALAALLFAWKGENARLLSEKKEWEKFGIVRENPFTPDYGPLAIKFFLVGSCYAGLMFVLRTFKHPASNAPPVR